MLTRCFAIGIKRLLHVCSFKTVQGPNFNSKITSYNNYVTHSFLGVSFLLSVSKDNQDGNVDDNDQLLRRADDLFESHKYSDCYLMLINCKASKTTPEIEIVWRICRVMYTLSKQPYYDEQFKQRIVFQAYDIINEQLQQHWDHYAVHKWYALLLDAKCSFDGLRARVDQFENVKKHMDLAITINPNDATTLHMLGEMCFQLADMSWLQRKTAEAFFPGLPNPTYEDALEYFLRAEVARPRFYCPNLLRIGLCCMRLNKDEQARYYIELAAAYPNKASDDHKTIMEAARLLKKLKAEDNGNGRCKMEFLITN